MEEKQRVISILRALLVSTGGKDGTLLRELKWDYCLHSGKSEIPLFGHKSVVEFLISSGEFILNVQASGLVTIRVKPKSFKLNVVTKQKSVSSPGTVIDPSSPSPTVGLNSKMAEQCPEHMSKSYAVNTFDQLNESSILARCTAIAQPRKNLQKEAVQVQRQSKVHGKNVFRSKEQVGTSTGGMPVLQTSKLDQGYLSCISNNANGISTTKKFEDSFNKVNRMCINFNKSLTCDTQKNYKTMLQIDCVKYVGLGRSSDEANQNAASKYLHAIDIGIHQKLKICRKPLNDDAPSSSFIKLNQMRSGDLHYLTMIHPDDDNKYKTVIQVDSVNYYGTGKSFQSSANNAAKTCLQSINRGLNN